MKNVFFIIIGLCSFYLAKAQNGSFTIPTNYTYTYFNALTLKDLACKSDSDCPEFSKCQSYEENKQTYSICRFERFLCPENGKGTCIFVNSTMWDFDDQSFNRGYSSKDYKPIIKTCPKSRLHSYRKRCRTDKCTEDSECLSGKCYSNNCIANEDTNKDSIMLCSGQEKKHFMLCGKNSGMKCSKRSECFSGKSYAGHCLKTGSFSYIMLLAAISLVAIIDLIYKAGKAIYKKKNKKDDKYKEMKDDNENEHNREVNNNSELQEISTK